MAAEEEKDPQGTPEEELPSAEEETPELEEPEPDEAGEEEEADEKIPMNVSVEDEGPCRKKVKIEIAAERVDEDIRKGLQDIKTSVPMPGFRKGRVPTMLLARRFGKKVKEEVRATLVSESIGQALENEGIRPFSMPEFSDTAMEEIALEEGKPLVFEFEVDVKPDIAVDNYVGIEVERPKVELEKEEVARELERLQRSRGRVAPVEDGKVEHGDVLVVTREYTYRKKSVHKEENATFPVPGEDSDIFEKLPWMKEFLGKGPGDVVERSFKFPDDFKDESVRGRQGRQRILIEDIKRLVPAEMDEAFLEDLGAASEEDLSSKIETQILAAKGSLADQIAEDRLVDALLERIPIELPEAVVEREVEQYMRRYEVRLRDQKVPEGEIAEQIEKLRVQRRKAVEKEFRAFFLLEEIARKEKIFATEEEVDRRVEAMAVNYGKWPSQMKEELENAGLLDQVRNQVKEEKVKTFLREKAKMKEGKLLDLKDPMLKGEEDEDEVEEEE